MQFGIEWAKAQAKLCNDPNYKPEVSINGHIMNADCHEDYQRAMLFAVFDALSLDFEKEIELYMKVIEREKEL